MQIPGLANVISVPGDYSTIQDAIQAAAAGDSILVAPGLYKENIDFLGKAITVKSTAGRDVTIIDGGSPINPDYSSVVTFENNEGNDSVLDGFTLTGGKGNLSYDPAGGIPDLYGGGVFCLGASPTIKNNLIEKNSAGSLSSLTYGGGGGIFCYKNAAPIIERNKLVKNLASNGGAICCYDAAATIMYNEIAYNKANYGACAIYCGQCTSGAVILKNEIYSNEIFSANLGGSIYLFGVSANILVNHNVINNNIAKFGIFLRAISKVIISDNYIEDASDAGICLLGASKNVISRNCVESCGIGIHLGPDSASGLNSKDNMVFHNDFLNNISWNAEDMGAKNRWDNWYPGGGNYWDDYTGSDLNGDDIGDTPHLFLNAEDSYPLMKRYNNSSAMTLPFNCDKPSLSVAKGGLLKFSIDSGSYNSLRKYIVFSSLSGEAPGQILPGGLSVLPINWDIFTNFTFQMINTPVYIDFMGVLDVDGKGEAGINTLGPIPAFMTGMTCYFAFALYYPWDYVSNALKVELTP